MGRLHGKVVILVVSLLAVGTWSLSLPSGARAEPSASLSTPHSDYGLDTDGDGAFNFLAVDVGVQVVEAGTFRVEGTLHGPTYSLWVMASQVIALDPGLQTVTLTFDGNSIRVSKTDGPYAINLTLWEDEPPASLDSGTHSTAAYSHVEFEVHRALLTTLHSDYGLDTDGDGLFNNLALNVSVQVGERQRYSVDATIERTGLQAANSSLLEVGFHTIPLRFEGRSVNESGLDGPYTVFLTLSYVFGELDRDTYRTANYSHLDFEDPPGAFSSPPTDFGLDTDGDGLFNYLVVETRVQIGEEDEYRFRARLVEPDLYTSNDTILGIGAHTVPLKFGGSRLNASEVDGPYTVELELSTRTEDLDTDTYNTSTYSHLDFEDLPAAFAPPHSDSGLDTDGDGLSNYLVVDVRILVQERETFYVRGRLTGGNWDYITSASNWTTLDVGLQTVPLWFAGFRINTSGTDGPYRVNLTLSSYIDLEPDTYTTASYSHLDFEDPPASFAPPHSDHGLDEDGDGLYDYLVAEVDIQVNEARGYGVSGSLSGRDGSYLVSTYNWTTLDVGLQTIPLWFAGLPLRAADAEGAYVIDLFLSIGRGCCLDQDTHTTGSYSPLAFEAPPGALSSPHADAGRDFDADGLFDFLEVNVTLQVEEAGWFGVSSTLYGENWYEIAWASEGWELDAGLHTIPLSFDGVQINTSAMDGPYSVNLTLYSGWWLIDSDTYRTSSYSHLDFEGPTASFSGPHSDSGLDTDGDRLFNYLLVEASVQVNESGGYRVRGYLYGAQGEDRTYIGYASNSTTLAVGLQTVSLRFDGADINESGVDGPYTVDLRLRGYDPYFVVWDEYTTGGYDHLDFNADAPAAYAVASFSPPHSDSGLDVDGDGLYDHLVVDVNIEVETGGTIRVRGSLSNEAEGNIDTAINVTLVDVGPATVSLWFNGTRINETGLAGPYTVDLHLRDVGYHFSRYDDYTTAYYSRLDFAGSPLPPTIQSGMVKRRPAIDGSIWQSIIVGEWSDATSVDLSRFYGNQVEGRLLVKNDDKFLYVALDATGDLTEDPRDVASISFDTDNDGTATEGGEHQFIQGGRARSGQAHLTYSASSGAWVEEDAPYDSGLPDHLGLVSAMGFGRYPWRPDSPYSTGRAHRIYEFSIPLAMLGVEPGDTLRFFGGSHRAPAIFDASRGFWSTWPVGTETPLPLSSYGEVILALDPTPPFVEILSPYSGALLGRSDVGVSWIARDEESEIEHVELRLDNATPITLGGQFEYTFTDLEEGTHTIVLTAFNHFGRSQTDSTSFTVDLTPPSTAIRLSGDAGLEGWFLSAVSVELSASDTFSDVGSITFRIDEGGWQTYEGPFLLEADGQYVLEFFATDAAGNEEPRTSASIGVDAVSPTITVTTPSPGSRFTSRDFEVAWRAGDNLGIHHFEVSLDGRVLVHVPQTTASVLLTEVTDGPHTITVKAVDRAGRFASETVEITVDSWIFSPTGPYGPGPLIGVIVAIAIPVLVLARRRWRPTVSARKAAGRRRRYP